MGRYSSVQAYGDNNANMRSIPYEQAAGSTQVISGSVKTEKVVNPYGSTAGAGSGDFHIYRHARAREAERIKQLNQEEKEKALDQEFEETLKKYQTEEEHKTAQRRKKRQRQREAKLKKKNMKLAGIKLDDDQNAQGDKDDEFTYTPVDQQEENGYQQQEETAKDEPAPSVPFANDGSFLEVMKTKLAAAPTNNEDDDDDDDDDTPPRKKQAVDS